MTLVTDFLRAIPDVFVELWRFGNGWLGVVVTLGSVVIVAATLFLADRTHAEHGWVSAIFGGMAATVTGFWLFGIIPSAWIYFIDGSKELLRDTVIPSEIAINDVTIMGNFYDVFRDSIVMAETTVAMLAMAVVALQVQKRYPRGLAEGEEKGPSSGGYK